MSADPQGDVSLDTIKLDDLSSDIDLLQTLIDVLEFKEMPPADQPAVEQDLRDRVVERLKQIRSERFRRARSEQTTSIRRMNRFQYNNAVIDLFDLKCLVFTLPERMMREHKGYFKPASGKMPGVVSVGSRPLGKSQMIERRLAGVAAFPQDLRAEHGYDNQADHLSMSPLLMESFLKLGSSITESPDFAPRNVGIWQEFFQVPESDTDLETDVKSRLQVFLTKAFRRPVGDETLGRYLKYAVQQLHRQRDFTDVMKSVASAVIASPRFLYLYGHPTESATKQDLDLELASRLSFFLWGSIPDQTLIDLASRGRLSNRDVLEQQVDRMLRDVKLKRFCDSFPSQWLQLERIISSVPDRQRFPEFYFSKYRASMHMMLEPLLLFETVLIENRPITTLIDPGFTYRSKLLEKHYSSFNADSDGVRRGGGAVGMVAFRRTPLDDRRLGGVITNAAVMTMTSGPQRTQPITRGAWVASVIFNRPPEPPPADVPALGEKPPADEAHLTLRERLSLHRERSDCRGCHEQIDPLGFALENYDPVGIWRREYENGRDVDSSGVLFQKHSFGDIVEFKDAVLIEQDRFTSGLAGHLLSFSLARKLTAEDQPVVEAIAAASSSKGNQLQTLIKEVIFSSAFLGHSGHDD